jgi:chemotaxis regulatin CheY-phosphate phosphatase CheZ
MKQVENMTQLFDKLNDLKSVFSYGQKIIPIIQSLIDFMKDTVPLLETINKSIAESTNKIPKAQDQINNVTSAHELATTEILDIVDIISDDILKMENTVKEIAEKEKKKTEILVKLTEYLKDTPDALALLDEYDKYNNLEDVVEGLLTAFHKIKDDAYNITISLQVQDVTAQQLAAVNHLIESVQDKLASLILDLTDAELQEIKEDNYVVPEGVAFNPNARYLKDHNNQQTVDTIMNDQKSKQSQDDIDKLFS